MTVFGQYASFYDFLYQDKAYEAECDFLEFIFTRYASKRLKTILDLGCGTGGHAIILARRGYSVVGVDRSIEMLRLAQKKESAGKVIFHEADICDLRLDKKFDAIISMFAVMNYMTRNEDLLSAFYTARHHLNPKGLFVFDSWFGPGVFHEPPIFRRKELVAEEKRVVRNATPTFDLVNQVIDIRFDVLETFGHQKISEVTEHHFMRPLFVQEVKHLATLNNLELLTVFPWMDIDRNVQLTDWLCCFILRAI
jgi:SAM-dependent methyltransferase